ncbi:(ABC) transporter, partial [Podila epigama]
MAEGKMELEQLDSAPAVSTKMHELSEKKPESSSTSTINVSLNKADKKKTKKGKKATDDSASNNSDADSSDAPVEKKAVSYFSLYRFATKKDYFYIIIASLSSIIAGVGQPMVALLMGNIIKDLSHPDPEVKSENITKDVILFTIIGAAMFLVAYLQMCFWTLAAENQIKRIREEYLHAILRQDIGWHDTGKQSESLTTRLNSDTQLIYDGIADKVGVALSSLVTFISGFVIGFVKGWKLALVLLSCVPLIGACAVMMMKFTVAQSSKGQDSYSKAGAVAEQAFSSIRTVVSFGGQKRETESYIAQLDEAFGSGKKRAIVTAIGIATFMFILFSTYGLAFWYGGHEVHRGNLKPEDILNVFMGMIMGAFALGNIGPNVAAFASAQGAAYNIFKTIDR